MQTDVSKTSKSGSPTLKPKRSNVDEKLELSVRLVVEFMNVETPESLTRQGMGVEEAGEEALWKLQSGRVKKTS